MTQNESIQPESMKHPEQGRSMIEMLGTLAIMGVLSIGGIAGYSYAVTKYKANETIDELNNRAIVYATQLKDGDLLSGTALRNGEFGDKTVLGYGVSATVSEYENEFNVTLSEIPFEVCEQILKNYTIPTEISVNGNIYNDMDENIDICGEGTANMVFSFNGDLSNDWEMVEVSGGPNNGETTELQTGMETTQPKDICQNLSYYPYCSQNVVKAGSYCASKGGYVSLSDIDCELKNNESSSSLCSRLKTLTGYYIIGKMAKVWSLPDNAVGCLCDYNITSENGSIVLQGYVENNNIPLCWDDYRDILAEYTGTENEESTTGTSTITQTPTITHSLSPEVTATVTPEVCECSSNAECGENSGEYCHFESASSCTEAPTCGTCESVSGGTEKVVLGVGTYVKSGSSMNWWSAQNYCEALEGSSRMATVADFGCGYDYVGANELGYCNTDTNTSSSGTRSTNMQAFQTAFGKSNYHWVSDLYSFCDAYGVLDFERILTDNRNNTTYSNNYALCRVGD